MGKVSYKMSREMYNTIKYPMVWNWKLQKMVKKGKPLTEKEISLIFFIFLNIPFHFTTFRLSHKPQ